MKTTEGVKVISTLVRQPDGVDSSKQANDPNKSNYEPELETNSRNRDNVMNAAEWNSHLIWARRERGPQFDMNTQMYQFDKQSLDYYTQSSDPSLGAIKNLLNQNEKPATNEDKAGRRKRY
ncbi:hypothetical protein E3Q19_00965 [Wallemia mellicola]|nr:hypothetical protein E3Q19_00965 [Wallemia mellicola]TIC13684.1 hypothetical protein E3Q14_01148 [Wallemia mellicola]